MVHKVNRIALVLGALVAGFAPLGAAAFPEKPVRIVVPFAPGGLSDQVARAFVASVEESKSFPTALAVVNVGGHFSAGARRVKEAQADGHEILLINTALIAGEASGVLDFGRADFEPIAATGETCFAPVVRRSLGVTSMKELFEKAKSSPEGLTFGANLGANNHIAGMMLAGAAEGAKFRFVQIGADAANFKALLGGHVDTSVFSGAAVAQYTLTPDGKPDPKSDVVALGYASAERSPHLPDLPTLREQGYDVEFCITNWWLAPKGTAPKRIAVLRDMLRKAHGTDRVQTFYKTSLQQPVYIEGPAFAQHIQAAWDRISPSARAVAKKP